MIDGPERRAGGWEDTPCGRQVRPHSRRDDGDRRGRLGGSNPLPSARRGRTFFSFFKGHGKPACPVPEEGHPGAGPGKTPRSDALLYTIQSILYSSILQGPRKRRDAAHRMCPGDAIHHHGRQDNGIYQRKGVGCGRPARREGSEIPQGGQERHIHGIRRIYGQCPAGDPVQTPAGTGRGHRKYGMIYKQINS